MKLDPQTFTETLRGALGERLVAVILYGSSATGEYLEKRSDVNLMVIVDALRLEVLETLKAPFRGWVKAGNRPPLLFTKERLRQSADVFPIELYDLRDQRKVLWGEDVIAELELTTAHLRHQLESELKGKLIGLREAYFACDGNPKGLVEVMVASLSNFQTLMRASLRLDGATIPAEKAAVTLAAAERLGFALEPFETVAAIKAGDAKLKGAEAEALFGRYLHAVEQLVDAVDAHL